MTMAEMYVAGYDLFSCADCGDVYLHNVYADDDFKCDCGCEQYTALFI